VRCLTASYLMLPTLCVNSSPDDSNNANGDALLFTKNVVVLDISGGPADLTLIDLPGIIRNTEKDEDKRYIPMIQDLVKEYISKENAVIVATVSCKDEIDNQVSMHACMQSVGDRTHRH
jgi:hypothetical protein